MQVLILTAYDDPALDREAMASWAYAYLVKGCEAQHLCQLTDQAWTHARTRRTELSLGSDRSG